ncbi:GTP-binding protein [Basidiobolus ranarum]|uniref:GTP-binding protein n=1 Tax=Basidiobolus ranarum TaxID=34480 RepID=A0ABR2VU32_9FUNG
MGIIVVFDVTDERSFNNVRNWIKNVEQHANEGVSKILIGNKCDIEDKKAVTHDQGEALAEEYGIQYVEASAKSKAGVEEAFYSLAREIKKKMLDTAPEQNFHPNQANNVQLDGNSNSGGMKSSCSGCMN